MSFKMIYDLSNYTQWLGSFIIMMLAFTSIKHPDRSIRIIGLIGFTSVLLQFVQTVISQNLLNNNYLNAIGDCYVFIEFLFFLAFYNVQFVNNRYLRLMLLGSAFLSFCIYILTLSVDTTYAWYALLRSTRDVLLIFFSIVTFFKLLADLPNENLLSLPTFWINSGILFYFSCTFMLSLTMDYIAQVLREDFGIFWVFRNLLRAGFCVVICIGIWKARKLPIKSNG